MLDSIDSLFTAGCGTATNTAATTLTLADIEKAMEALHNMPPEPIGEWMRSQGCPPEKWVLLIPPHDAYDSLFLPEYVKVSRHINKPVFIPRG